MIRKCCAWAAVCASLAGGPALAVDGMAIELGGSDDTVMSRVALQWNWQRRLHQGPGWNIGGYWDLALGYWYWRRDGLPGYNDDIAEIALTPVLRLQRDDSTGFYCEIGVGLHLQSKSAIGDRQMSTLAQFGSHAGVGYRFGAKGAYDISYRFQHLSNADFKIPNDGINFSQIRLQYHF